MKKLIVGILLLALMLPLVACGGEAVTKDVAAIKEQIITQLAIEDAMDISTESLLALYGIEAASVKNSACFITMGSVFTEDVVIVEAVDSAAAKEIAGKLEAVLASKANQAAGYSPEDYAQYQKCKVQKDGVYVALFISAKCEQMQKIFEDAK